MNELQHEVQMRFRTTGEVGELLGSVTRATKILAITGYAEGMTRAQILHAGADGYLEKPLPLAVLHAEIARLLRDVSSDSAALPLSLGSRP